MAACKFSATSHLAFVYRNSENNGQYPHFFVSAISQPSFEPLTPKLIGPPESGSRFSQTLRAFLSFAL